MKGKKELSTRALPLLADIEHHQIINIEKGRVIRLSTLLKISKTLGILLEELIRASQYPTK